MAVVALTSASGSPGVTTTAVALALSWPRPVMLVEADPTGGSGILAGFLRGTSEYEAGLIELALSPLGIAEALRDVVRPLAGNATFVAGTRSPTQAGALREVWEPLASVLAALEVTGQDVLIDTGRLGLAGSPVPLLDSADLTLLCTAAHLPALAAARGWAQRIKDPATGWRHPGLLLIGEGRQYTAGEVTGVLGLPVIATLPDDADAAAVYHRGAAPPRRFESGPYIRAVAAAVQSIRTHLARDRSELIEAVAR